MKIEILYCVLAIAFVWVFKVGSRDPYKEGLLRILAIIGLATVLTLWVDKPAHAQSGWTGLSIQKNARTFAKRGVEGDCLFVGSVPGGLFYCRAIVTRNPQLCDSIENDEAKALCKQDAIQPK